jgi:CheY-specific phosphatase CheX
MVDPLQSPPPPPPTTTTPSSLKTERQSCGFKVKIPPPSVIAQEKNKKRLDDLHLIIPVTKQEKEKLVKMTVLRRRKKIQSCVYEK